MRPRTIAIILLTFAAAFAFLASQQAFAWLFAPIGLYTMTSGPIQIEPSGDTTSFGSPTSALHVGVRRDRNWPLSLAMVCLMALLAYPTWAAQTRTRIRKISAGCVFVGLSYGALLLTVLANPDSVPLYATISGPALPPLPWWCSGRTERIALDPTYDIGLLLGALLTGLGIYLWRKTRAFPEGRCRHCGYNLIGNTSGICPECGTPIPVAGPQS
jgi:hypothetical protein